MRQSSFTRDELLACGRGEMFGPENGRLPLPNMLLMDRIVGISATGGRHHKGNVAAELDVHPNLWFFSCHFQDDPVMPGCLGLDALWQLLGFFLSWSGFPGRGRALGVGQVKFFGQVLPKPSTVRYELDIVRVIERRLTMGIGNGRVLIDDREIYIATDLRVGLFTSLAAF